MGYKSVLHVNTQVDAGTANTDTNVVTKPTGLAVDDLMLAFCLTAIDTVTPPSGWTQLDSDDASNMRSIVFYKFAVASDVSASSFTFTAGSALGPFCTGISAYRNVDTSAPFNVQGQGIDNAGTDPITVPTVVTTQPSLVVHYLSVRELTTTIPTFTSSGETARTGSGFGNHGASTAYAMTWYDSGTTPTAGSQTGITINPTGTVTQTIARSIALRALPLNSSDSASADDQGQLAFSVNQTDGVTGTDRTVSIGSSTVNNVDAVIVNNLNSIVATFDAPWTDAATGTELNAIRLVDRDNATALQEIGAVQDTTRPSRSDAAGLSNESQGTTAYVTNRDIAQGNEYQTTPGGTVAAIRDYRATLIQGPADIYVADFGTVEPTKLGVTIPPPSAYWTHVGGTKDGVTITVLHTFNEFDDFRNISDRPGRRLKRRRVTAEVELAEPTLDNILYAVDNGSYTTGVGYKVYTPPATVDRATVLTYKAVIIHGWAPGLRADGTQKRRMIIMRKCLSVDPVRVRYDKEEQTTLPIKWAVHRVSNTVAPFIIIDEI